MKLVHKLDNLFYPGIYANWDDKLFREMIEMYIDSNKTILDLGAGRGNVKEMNFREGAKKVCGVDLDSAVLNNPFLDEAKIITEGEIPYSSQEFDLIFSDNVLEHVDNPSEFFNEVYRLLKPGGYFLAKTPNVYHYMPLIAKITPTWFHAWINKIRGREQIDTFPTRYKCNSKGVLEKISRQAKLEVKKISCHESRPEYLRMNILTYILGIIYERTVNLWSGFEPLRVVLICVLRKRA